MRGHRTEGLRTRAKHDPTRELRTQVRRPMREWRPPIPELASSTPAGEWMAVRPLWTRDRHRLTPALRWRMQVLSPRTQEHHPMQVCRLQTRASPRRTQELRRMPEHLTPESPRRMPGIPSVVAARATRIALPAPVTRRHPAVTARRGVAEAGPVHRAPSARTFLWSARTAWRCAALRTRAAAGTAVRTAGACPRTVATAINVRPVRPATRARTSAPPEAETSARRTRIAMLVTPVTTASVPEARQLRVRATASARLERPVATQVSAPVGPALAR
jgi:hypothetical protein